MNYRKLTESQIRQQGEAAGREAGKKFILTPGCSVPNDNNGRWSFPVYQKLWERNECLKY
jgi:hypothetical protein